MKLNDSQKKELLSLKPEDITAEFIYSNMAHKTKKGEKFIVIPPKYNTNDTFYLEKGEYFNKERVLTTVGQFIYNKRIIEYCGFQDIVGYIAEPIDGKKHKAIEATITEALINNKVTEAQMAKYFDTYQWLAMQFNPIFVASFTMESITPRKDIIAERDKLLKENEDRIKNGDIKTIVDIEKKLVKKAKDDLKGDPGMEMYDSGARASFDNAYKNCQIMKGAVYAQGEWHVIPNNYSEGLQKEDLHVYANAMIGGQYPKSVGTQTSGYLLKRLIAANQAIVADEPGSDCKTKHTLDIVITPSNKKLFEDRYIVEGDKLVQLTKEVIDKYVNKKVKLRTIMYCKGGNHPCSRCVGEGWYKIGIRNIGLSSMKVASTMLNLNMKKFHNATADLYNLNINDLTV